VPNVHNMSLTAGIDVLFSLNFAVVFDFMYFCFRPSKAISIGNFLPKRRNAAMRSMFFFLLYNAHCLGLFSRKLGLLIRVLEKSTAEY
jgi:hypothetical protein